MNAVTTHENSQPPVQWRHCGAWSAFPAHTTTHA